MTASPPLVVFRNILSRLSATHPPGIDQTPDVPAGPARVREPSAATAPEMKCRGRFGPSADVSGILPPLALVAPV